MDLRYNTPTPAAMPLAEVLGPWLRGFELLCSFPRPQADLQALLYYLCLKGVMLGHRHGNDSTP